MNATVFSKQVGIELPIIGGAMYPCSNPELVAAVSQAGGIGIIQPISLVYAHKHDFRQGLHLLRSLTSKPLGFNAIVEKSSKVYEERMRSWIEIALEEGIRFFVTALGNPAWVVKQVHAAQGLVYHNVTARSWAEKALAAGVDGLICVNNQAGGHAGKLTPRELYEAVADLKVPLICAGGVGSHTELAPILTLGYNGIQMGTRFIATTECTAHQDYKQAIVTAQASDIVLTEKISGVPVAVIKTPYLERMGTQVGPIARYLLRHRKTKHWLRLYYSLRSLRSLKRSSLKGGGYHDVYQAGKSVEGITAIESVSVVMQRFADVFHAGSANPSLSI